jgi:hypothetical protein
MTEQERHAEAHRLKTECRYSERRISAELGITRYAVKQLLARPLPQPVADQKPPVAEPVAEVADQERPVADQRPSVAEGVVVAAAPVGHVAGVARFPLPGARSPWLRIDLSRRRGLLRDLVALARVGLQIPHVVEDVIRAFAAAYHQAVATGQLAPGQAYDMQIRVRPCRH